MNSIIKKLKKYNQKYFQYLFTAYFVAAISFAISLLRDFMLISYTHYSKDLFELFYFTGLISIFVINSIMIKGSPNKKNLLYLTFIFSVMLCLVGYFILSIPYKLLALSLITFFIWILGAIMSRTLISREKIFLGRFRESICSLMIIILIILNFNFELNIIISLLVSLFWVTFVSWEYKGLHFSNSKQNTNYKQFFMSLVLTNLSGAIMLLWALQINRSVDLIFGFDPTVVVRFSLYFYQFFTIGSVIIIIAIPKYFKENKLFTIIIYCFLIFISLFAFIISTKLSVFILPVTLSICRYLGIIIVDLNLLKQQHQQSKNLLNHNEKSSFF